MDAAGLHYRHAMPLPVTTDNESDRAVDRSLPNIHICGNPGTGKTSLAKKIVEEFDGLSYLDLGKEGKARGCIDGRDEQLDCDILDYEKLADALVPEMEKGGKVVDWIHADFWEPSSLIDLVIVLTCDNTVLYDRYKARGYNEKKIEQNIDSEIMQEIVMETKEYYEGSDLEEDDREATTLTVLKSDTEQQMSSNLERVITWIENFQKNAET